MASKALIFGITGQDGAYLAHELLRLGWLVYGTSRDRSLCRKGNLRQIGVLEDVTLISVQPSDFRSVYQAITETRPDVIFNLSGQTSVALSFEQPVEAIESIATATLNILETLRMIKFSIKFVNVGSSECFGETPKPVDETAPFMPRSPYAVAKSTAAWHVRAYREAYHLHASTAIMSNHESPLRGPQFVTQRLIEIAKQASQDLTRKEVMGDLSVVRDWGWAPDYVAALFAISELDEPDDFIVATGISHSLEQLAQRIFQRFDLDYKTHILISKQLFRPLELRVTKLNPMKLKSITGWEPKVSFEKMLEKLAISELF